MTTQGFKADGLPAPILCDGGFHEMVKDLEEVFGGEQPYGGEFLAHLRTLDVVAAVVDWEQECRHCGNWSGTIRFYNQEGHHVESLSFSD